MLVTLALAAAFLSFPVVSFFCTCVGSWAVSMVAILCSGTSLLASSFLPYCLDLSDLGVGCLLRVLSLLAVLVPLPSLFLAFCGFGSTSSFFFLGVSCSYLLSGVFRRIFLLLSSGVKMFCRLSDSFYRVAFLVLVRCGGLSWVFSSFVGEGYGAVCL